MIASASRARSSNMSFHVRGMILVDDIRDYSRTTRASTDSLCEGIIASLGVSSALPSYHRTIAARSRFLFLSRDYFRSPRAMRTRHRAAKSAAKGEARSRVNWSRTVAPLLAGYRPVSAARDFDVRREIQHARRRERERERERERDLSGGERVDNGNESTRR